MSSKERQTTKTRGTRRRDGTWKRIMAQSCHPIFVPSWFNFFACIAVCGVLLGVLPLSVRAADVDLPTYLQRLTAARDAVTQAQPLAGPPRDAAIQRARDALTGI